MRGRSHQNPDREGGGRPSRCAPLFIAIALLCASAPHAPAQLLNLDAPGAPAPGEGKAALALADRMKADIDRLSAGAAGDASGSLHAAAVRFSAEMRRLVRMLALRAEDLGEPGSAHLLAARTLAAGLPQIDALADRMAGGADLGLILAAQQFLRDQAGATADEEAARKDIPEGAGDLDRYLRDRLALLVEAWPIVGGAPSWRDALAANTAGWVRDIDAGEAATDLSASIDRWSAAGLLRPATADTLRALATDVLAPAESLVAYRAQARGMPASIARAGRAIEGLPVWVTDGAKARLAARFDGAVTVLMDRTTQDAGLSDLARFARLGAIVSRLDPPEGAVAAAPPRSILAAREALLTAGAPPEGVRPKAATETIDVFDRATRLMAQRRALGAEADLIREVRPAWRVLDQSAKKTESDLWAALARLGPGVSAPSSDPALVGALAAHRRAIDDLLAAGTISRVLADGTMFTTSAHRLALARALRLAQDLAKPDRREASLTTLRRAAADFDDLLSLPGEADLHAVIGDAGNPDRAAWAALTGDRAPALVAAIDAARKPWLDAWAAEKDSPTGGAARLRAIAPLVETIADAVAVRSMSARLAASDRGGGGIQSWPGFDTTDAALGAMTDGLDERLSRAAAAAATGDDKALAPVIKDLQPRRSVLHLLAALERIARARSLSPLPVAVEVACPPAPDAWLIDSRADLGAVCRYLDEYADAGQRRDSKRADRLLSYLSVRAESVSKRLSP